MPYIDPSVLDAALTEIKDNANSLVICSSLPSSYAGAVSATLGTKASPTISSPQARADGAAGRRIVVSAITDGTVSADGTATCVALLDTDNSVLLIAKEYAEDQTVTNGGTFKTSEISIDLPAFDNT